MTGSENGLQCRECPMVVNDYLGDHLLEAHGITVAEYQVRYPGVSATSQRLQDRVASVAPNRRAHPPAPNQLTISFANVTFPVNWDVPAHYCLPMPPHYRVPQFGNCGEDVQHIAIAMKHRRSIYAWGLPGSGKDALFHAWSFMTRSPAIIRQVRPGTDIEAWFFSRAFNQAGTYWEEGELLKALRDGFLTTTGRRIPYLVLVTDFDRADREQAEALRLVTDSIQGRVPGPGGHVDNIIEGTVIAVTANTAGGGDERGRMVSANPVDASLMDRFERKFEVRWMDWRDESEIVKSKFPALFQRCPSILDKMGATTRVLREAILNGDLHAEFSHRGVCTILGHAEDLVLESTGRKIPKNLMQMAARAWVDGLPDQANRENARNIMDPHLNTLNEGDVSHIASGPLAGAK